MTIATFFDSVITASGHPETHEPIQAIIATFDWKEQSDINKTFIIRRDFDDSFDIFLETVAGAPCWEQDGGRCSVAVELVEIGLLTRR